MEAKDFEADPGEYDVPDSVIGFLHGELGDPPGGWPEPFRTRALAGRPAPKGVTELTDDDRAGLHADDGRDPAGRRSTGCCSPGRPGSTPPTATPTATRRCSRPKDFLYGLERDVEHTVELEPGVTLLIELGAVSEPDERGMRTVVTTLNGQLRPVTVRDRSVEVDVEARGEGGPREPRPRRGPVRGRGDAGGRERRDGGAGPRRSRRSRR